MTTNLMAFASGNELYSGGAENVLVKWQLTSQRQYFLPRLGLPIRFISTDTKNNLLITAHIDNGECRVERVCVG